MCHTLFGPFDESRIDSVTENSYESLNYFKKYPLGYHLLNCRLWLFAINMKLVVILDEKRGKIEIWKIYGQYTASVLG